MKRAASLTTFILALATPPATSASAQEAPLGPRETLLEVAATGSVRRVPDRATLTVSVSADADSGSAAVAVNARAADRLQAAARRAVPAAVLRTTSVTLRPRYHRDANG